MAESGDKLNSPNWNQRYWNQRYPYSDTAHSDTPTVMQLEQIRELIDELGPHINDLAEKDFDNLIGSWNGADALIGWMKAVTSK